MRDIPLQIWDVHTTLGVVGLPIILIRALHNKLIYLVINFTQCYLHYLSPRWFVYQLGLTKTVFVVIVIWLLYSRVARLRKIILTLAIIYPIIMVFELYKLI